MTEAPPPPPAGEPPPAKRLPRPPKQKFRRSRLNAHEAKWAPLVHLAAIPAMLLALGFAGPLLVGRYRTGGSPFVRHHVVQAVNFNVTVGLLGTASILVMAFSAHPAAPVAPGEPPKPQWVPATALMALLVIMVLWILFVVRAAMGAREGEWYRYPPSLPVMR